MSTQLFGSFERESATLEAIASGYEMTSGEHQAIRLATLALFFAVTKHGDAFKEFLLDCQKDLTPEEKAHLAEMGLADTPRPERGSSDS